MYPGNTAAWSLRWSGRPWRVWCKEADRIGGAQECLKEGFNPCSPEEIAFLKAIGKESLIEKSMVSKVESKFACVDRIEGSYFNVMGLPIVELHAALKAF